MTSVPGFTNRYGTQNKLSCLSGLHFTLVGSVLLMYLVFGIWSFYFLVLNCEQSRWCGLLYLLIRKLWGFNQKVSSNDDCHRLCHCPFLPTYDCFICSHFEFNLSSSVEEFAFWLTLTRVPSTICFNIFGLLDAFTALLCCGFVGWLQTEETINYFRHRRGWFKTIFRDIFT